MPRLKAKKREHFCHEYIKDGNATKSAEVAGYSKRTAKQIGSKLLTFIDVAERIRELQDKASQKYGISMQMIVDEHKTIAFKKNADPEEKISLNDKRGSLDSLTKILGGFVDKKEIKTEQTITHKVSPEIKSALDEIYES